MYPLVSSIIHQVPRKGTRFNKASTIRVYPFSSKKSKSKSKSRLRNKGRPLSKSFCPPISQQKDSSHKIPSTTDSLLTTAIGADPNFESRALSNSSIFQPTPVSATKSTLPSLDLSSHNQINNNRSWIGNSTNLSSPTQNILPTPPGSGESESFIIKPGGQNSMAAVLQPQSTMSNGLGSGSSLISRRTAGNNLPGPLELPVNALSAKFGAPISSSILPTVNNHHSQSNINALLTPPSNVSGENLSPISSGANSSSNLAAIGIPPYSTNGYYQSQPYSSASSSQGQTQTWNQSLHHYPRGRFSPSLASLMRNPSTGSPSESLPPPSYDLGALPPFPNNLTHPGPLSPPPQQQQQHQQQQQPQQQQQHHHHQQPPQHQHSGSLPYNMTSGAPPPPLHSPITAQDSYMQQKLPPTPSYYQSMTPQTSHFPQYSTGSPSIASPLSATTPTSRISPISQTMPGYNRPYPMQGIHSPGHMPPGYGSAGFHQQPIFNSGHAAQIQHTYGTQSCTTPLDRPFKCDQCPQSFNRNHDLKRHKRIHLAVKPFPCKYCDKSFSRKDALKVHSYHPTCRDYIG